MLFDDVHYHARVWQDSVQRVFWQSGDFLDTIGQSRSLWIGRTRFYHNPPLCNGTVRGFGAPRSNAWEIGPTMSIIMRSIYLLKVNKGRYVCKVEKHLKGSMQRFKLWAKVCSRLKAKHCWAKEIFENKKFVDITQQCFALLPQVNFPSNNLNFYWR